MPRINEEGPQEKRNPDDTGPFRLGGVLKRNKREVFPDANRLTIVNIEDSPGYWATGRRWFLRNHGPVYLLVMFTLALSYAVPHYYAPQFTDLIFGLVVAALVGGASISYEWEKRQDKQHNTFVDLIQIALKETIVGRTKGKEGTESHVIVPKITRREIHLAKDYMFDGDDKFTIKKINAQIVGSFGKIIDVSEIDDTGRIIIGEGEGDLPSGLVVKIGYPSRSQLTRDVQKADKARKNGAISEKQFLTFKGAVDQYNAWQNHIIEMAETEGITMIDIDRMSKEQRSFFVALDKESTRYWTGEGRNDPMTLQEWKNLEPSIMLPKILRLQQEYNDIKNEKVDLLINRQSDKMEAELGATLNLMEATGMSEEAVKQFLVEQRKGLVSYSSKSEEDMEGEVNAGSGE